MAEFSQAPYSAAFNVRTGAGQAVANEIADLQYADQVRARNQAMNEAKLKAFMDDIEFQNGSNPFDEPIIRTENEDLIRKVGSFYYQNASRWHDPVVRLQAKQLAKSQRSTDAVLRSIGYKDSENRFKEFLSEAAKNPGRYNQKAIDDQRMQMDNYRKYGHPLGAKAAKKEGPQLWVFKRPVDFIDENKLYNDTSKTIARDVREDVNNGRIGAYKKYASDDNILTNAKSIYDQYPEQFDQTYGPGAIQKIAQILKTKIEPEFFEGYQDEFALFKRKANYEAALKKSMQTQSTDPYKVVIFDSNNIAPTDEKAIAATFGSTPTVQYKGPDGKVITESGNRFYWTGLRDKGYLEDGKYVKDGLKIGDGFIIKPIEYGKELGVLEDTAWFGEKLEVKPEYADSYEIFTPPPNEKGESVPVLKIRAQTEVNAGLPDYARKFNAYIHSTTKQREGVGETSLLNQDVYRDDAGNLFIKDAAGNPIPYQR